MYANSSYKGAAPIQSILQFFQKRSMLSQLILINLALWMIVNLINVFVYLFMSNVFSLSTLLALPSNINSILFKPWTLFTYMFLHTNIFHIGFNMLMLYFSGQIFLQFLNQKQLVSTYIFGGLFGAIFYILSFNIFPRFNDVVTFSTLMGASASVLAILIGIATYAPLYTVNLMFLGPVKLKHLAIGFVVLDILSIDKGNSGGHLAHLGGAFWGFLYALQLKKGKDISKVFDSLFAYFNFPKKSKMYVNKNYTEKKRTTTDEQYNKLKKEKQAQIDHILDKIAKSGYESLSKQEKELLFDSSNRSNI